MIRILSDGTPKGTKVFTSEFAEINNITGIDLSIRPDSGVIANVQVFTNNIDVTAHPLLTMDTIAKSVEMRGLSLINKDLMENLKNVSVLLERFVREELDADELIIEYEKINKNMVPF